MQSRSAFDLLIVGASGRVGRLLQPAFAGMQAPVAMTARDGAARGQAFAWSPLLSDAPLLAWVAHNGAPAAMLVLAGSTPSTGDDMTPNVALGRACVAAARKAGIGRVLLASSSAVYGHGREAPWREDDPADPPSAYGQAKLAMERDCSGADVCALRIGNVAGADALLANPRRPLVIDRFADGTGPWRSYIGPQSLARVVMALARTTSALPPVLNVGTPHPVSMSDLATAAGLPFDWRAAPPSAIARLTLDTARLESLVGFEDRESTAPEIVAQWRACQSQPEPRP